jgi:ankyrin repeat protein
VFYNVIFAANSAALENDRTLVNSICVRTGLQPLHKAVEAGNTSLVKVLLEFGADRHAPAPLYDNETPIDMAQRFAQQDIIDLLHA